MRYLILLSVFILSVSGFAGEAQVKYLIGDVDFKGTYKQSEWDALRMNATVQEDNILRTGSRSRCEVRLEDGSIIRMNEYAMLQLTDLPENGQPAAGIFALIGKVYFNVKKTLTNNFVVKSPASVASVSGTEFILSNTKTRSEIWVKEGMVNFSDADSHQSVVVRAGEKSVVVAGKVPSPPESLSPAEMDQFTSLAGTSSNHSLFTGLAPAAAVPQANSPDPEPQYDENLPIGRSDDAPFGMGFSVGAVTIDKQVYTQLSLMPEIVVGKFGLALDLRIFIDSDGNIRKDNWDSFNDVLEKIYYMRWGLKGDPFYVRVGAINNYRLGYGILMNRYYNTIQYPTVIRTGMTLGIDAGGFVFDAMLNDFKELGRKQGGLFAGRIGYRFLGDLEIGASVVYDRNQYATLRDRDGDSIPDALDDFPDVAGSGRAAVDSDGDGVPDLHDPDRDGNGYTDNSQDPLKPNNEQVDPRLLKPDPFLIQSAPDRDQIAFAADIGYPFIRNKTFELVVYSQAAKFGYGGGWGYTVPGIRGKAAFINFFGEYRIQEPRFIPEYFSTTYELDRVVIQDSTGSGGLYPITKRDILHQINTRTRGYVIGADFNLFDVVIFGAEYQRLTGTGVKLNTLRMDLDLNTAFVPKFKKAGVYFYQQNADDLFTITEGTVAGARLQYEISPGAALLLDYRETYKDLNGDGRISGSDETIKTTNIQTVFSF